MLFLLCHELCDEILHTKCLVSFASTYSKYVSEEKAVTCILSLIACSQWED